VWLGGLALLYFAVLMFFAVRTVSGPATGPPPGCLSLVGSASGRGFRLGAAAVLLGWLASPFFLFYAWYYLAASSATWCGLRNRQHFHRMLESPR